MDAWLASRLGVREAVHMFFFAIPLNRTSLIPTTLRKVRALRRRGGPFARVNDDALSSLAREVRAERYGVGSLALLPASKLADLLPPCPCFGHARPQ